MKLLLFLLSLSLLLILIDFGQFTSIKDSNNGVMGFIYEAKGLAAMVRSDIEQLRKDMGNFNSAKMRENQLNVLQHFKNVNIQVQQIEQKYVSISRALLIDLPATSDPEDIDFEKIDEIMLDVSDDLKLMMNMEKYEIATLISFTNAVAAPRHTRFSSTLKNEFYSMLFGLDCQYISKDMLTQEVKMFEKRTQNRCKIQQSPQQFVYSMYKDIALTELKAYILTEYSLMIRSVSEEGYLIDEWKTIRHNYKERNENGLSQLRNMSRQADRQLWRCDPAKHEQNVTYDEVTRLLQGYIENEVDLSTKGSCTLTCPYYQNVTRTGCFDQKFCSQQPQCSGRIYNCQFANSELSVCQSPVNSTRRYDYIHDSKGRHFGEQRNCWRDTDRVVSWMRWIFWRCSYCFCLCDEQGPKSDRYFNLRATYSDVKANKVVTGVRFVKKNRIFHLQIQQGQLLPRGAINESTVEWKPIDDYKLNDFNVTEGVDYHSMSYGRRGIDLDDITMNAKAKAFVVTGVRFRVSRGRLNLIVLFSYFDFVKGLLVEPETIGLYQSHNDIEERKELHLNNLDVPTRSRDSSQPLSSDGQYLEFVNSGMEQDAGQTTVPFIDIQDVVSNPPVPLAGIGIYYKGSQGYGGFVASKIISYDLSPHLPLPAVP